MGRPRTGTLEPAGAWPSGAPRWRFRLRLADGTKSERFELPEGYDERQARAQVAKYQADEDVHGGILNAKREKQRERSAAAGVACEGETCDAWFARYAELRTALGTRSEGHVDVWRRWVSPIIGTKPIASLTRTDIIAVRDRLTGARTDGEIAAKTAMTAWSVAVTAPLSRAFTDDDPRHAPVRVGPYSANPAHGVKPPVSGDDIAEDERERQALEPDEADALLRLATVPLATQRLYAWAMFTGVRPAELYGLDWTDVRERVIKVQRARAMRASEDETRATKNRQSIRDVPIHPHLAPLVEAMRREAGDTGRVFPLTHAREAERRAGELRAYLKAAGITRAELHEGTPTLQPFDVRSFRTCFATWCARSGFDSAWIDAWLGHAPKTTAAKHYMKATGELLAGVFPRLPKALLGGNGPAIGPRRPQVPATKRTRPGGHPGRLQGNTKLLTGESVLGVRDHSPRASLANSSASKSSSPASSSSSSSASSLLVRTGRRRFPTGPSST